MSRPMLECWTMAFSISSTRTYATPRLTAKAFAMVVLPVPGNPLNMMSIIFPMLPRSDFSGERCDWECPQLARWRSVTFTSKWLTSAQRCSAAPPIPGHSTNYDVHWLAGRANWHCVPGIRCRASGPASHHLPGVVSVGPLCASDPCALGARRSARCARTGVGL